MLQTYLQSLTVRLEEMRVKRRDTEQWMRHRQLPLELKERVRRYDQYKWVATRGVDEGLLLQSLPLDLRRDIKRHLCLEYVRRVRSAMFIPACTLVTLTFQVVALSVSDAVSSVLGVLMGPPKHVSIIRTYK